MTEPSTGAGGTAVVKRFNQGDRVFIPAVIHAEYEGRTQPIYEVLALGDVPADRVLPSSDALPAVARWMAETPNALEDLRTLRWAIDQLGHIDEEQAVPTLDALIAALSTDGGA